MVLTIENICDYLLENQLIDKKAIIEGDLLIRDVSSRNTNFLVNQFHENGIKILIKQPDINDNDYIESMEVEAANLMRFKACALFDAGQPCGAEANMAKYLAAKASWEAANACIQFHGGFGFACEYDVERKFRETRLYQVAPISTNLILSYVAEHVLGLPRSF